MGRPWRYLAFTCLCALPLAACVQIPTNATDGGTDCGQDPTTGVTLCMGSSVCPSISVNQDTLPECGFLIQEGTDVIDLECVCGDYLCPIGQPATCAEATTMLSTLTSVTVCEETAEGKCIQEVVPQADAAAATTATTAAPAATTTAAPTTTTCNTQCLVNCGDEPDCQLLCGC